MVTLSGVVAIAGSRSLSRSGCALVGKVCQSLVSSGCSLVTGCATGADYAAFSSVQPGAIRVLCAFGQFGRGAGPASAAQAVQAFSRAGGSVQWWAGGQGALRSRLTSRTRAVVGSATGGLVCFLSSPHSRGSLLACSTAASRSLPVVVFPVGFPAAQLPLIGAGKWVPCGGVLSGGFLWVSHQGALI